MLSLDCLKHSGARCNVLWGKHAHLVLNKQIKQPKKNQKMLLFSHDSWENDCFCALPCRAPLSRKLFRLNRVFLEARYWMKRWDKKDKYGELTPSRMMIWMQLTGWDKTLFLALWSHTKMSDCVIAGFDFLNSHNTACAWVQLFKMWNRTLIKKLAHSALSLRLTRLIVSSHSGNSVLHKGTLVVLSKILMSAS